MLISPLANETLNSNYKELLNIVFNSKNIDFFLCVCIAVYCGLASVNIIKIWHRFFFYLFFFIHFPFLYREMTTMGDVNGDRWGWH